MSAFFPVRPKPVVLAILDGWGHNPIKENNAIAQAHTPCYEHLLRHYPWTLINASELHVGLPRGQMGNSEVGHMNIGSGRVVMQDLPRIDEAIANGELERNSKLISFIAALHASGGACHMMGLLSPGGVHSHQAHMAALAKLIARAGITVYIHAFLDGRDTPPQSARDYIKQFETDIQGVANIHIATLSGRYFAMDRDKRWERVEQAYSMLMAGGVGAQLYHSADAYIAQCYRNGRSDEFIPPAASVEYKGMQDGDAVLMTNFRADRARQLLTAMLDPDFPSFKRGRVVSFTAALGMVEYSTELNRFLQSLFQPEMIHDTLGEVVSQAGLKQLRIAETEKYAHVTFFFNAGIEQPLPGEERILVPSPKVATYDLQPEMSAPEVTDKLVSAIETDLFDLIVVNYANTDMVGHSGNIEAAKKAVEAVDIALQRVSDAVLKKGGALLVTADHGNAEQMHDHDTHQAHTAHTLNLVPAVLVAPALKNKKMQDYRGRLADIAPTILDCLGLRKPAAMTGKSLLEYVNRI